MTHSSSPSTSLPTPPRLLLRRHRHLLLRRQRVLRAPQTRHRLPLGVETNAVRAVEVGRARAGDGLLVAGEAEHGEGHGDGDVDADLAGFEGALEELGGGAGAGEDLVGIES